jgi:hypothetical protein
MCASVLLEVWSQTELVARDTLKWVSYRLHSEMYKYCEVGNVA